jgi:hypothetical protein
LHAPGLAQVSGVQEQVFVVVLHVSPPEHEPQFTVTPHPVSVPHLPVQSLGVGGEHATHWCVVVLQMSGASHGAHVTGVPHESMIVPHCAPWATHVEFAAWQRCVSELQTKPVEQLPQSTGAPQPSSINPQALTPRRLQTFEMQASRFSAPSGKNSGPESTGPESSPPLDPLPSPPPELPSSPPDDEPSLLPPLDPSPPLLEPLPSSVVASPPFKVASMLPLLEPSLPPLLPSLPPPLDAPPSPVIVVVPSAPESLSPPPPFDVEPDAPPHPSGVTASARQTTRE